MLALGIAIDWGKPRIAVDIPLLQRAEQLGYHSVWAAEAYGSDALTPLAYIAGHTQHLKLGTAIAQVSARTPTSLAMSMATLDQLSGDGRVVCGLGLSGPQVVEGWYGQPWAKPASRLRDYVAIMRSVWQRQGPAEYQGQALSLPYAGEGASGMGKALKSILHANADIPIYLGTGSAKMVALTAEVADGWLPFGFVPGCGPGSMSTYQASLEAGFATANKDKDKPVGSKSLDNFAVVGGVQVIVNDDVAAAINQLKPMVALYVGGMGAKQKNFHKDLMVRRGYADAAEAIQQAFLAGDMEAVIAAVPDEYVDDAALLGSKARIKERLARWQDSGATELILHMMDANSLEVIAEVADLKPR